MGHKNIIGKYLKNLLKVDTKIEKCLKEAAKELDDLCSFLDKKADKISFLK
jgi:hypothetical protein